MPSIHPSRLDLKASFRLILPLFQTFSSHADLDGSVDLDPHAILARDRSSAAKIHFEHAGPRIIRSLEMELSRDDFEYPPKGSEPELVIDRAQNVHDVLVLLADEVGDDSRPDRIVIDERLGRAPGQTAGRVGSAEVDRRWSRFDDRIQTVWVEPDVFEHLAMEKDSRTRQETLADHPSKRNTSERIASAIRNGTTTNVGMAACKPDLFCISNGGPVRCELALEIDERLFAVLAPALGHLAMLHAELIIRFGAAMPEAWVEPRAMLI